MKQYGRGNGGRAGHRSIPPGCGTIRWTFQERSVPEHARRLFFFFNGFPFVGIARATFRLYETETSGLFFALSRGWGGAEFM